MTLPELRATLFAPWSIVPVLAVSTAGSSDAGIGSDLFLSAFLGSLIGVPIAYCALAIVGWPAYLLLKRVGLVRSWSLCLVGVVAGMTLGLITVGPSGVWFPAVCGLAVAASAWLFLRYSRDSGRAAA
jgi:hypothetical protein